ncbi:hypothetical protein FRB95_006150 [Tulasnella sp. JGI-2019a]|nr:hypothetical protein FRB93_000776 [Tulasnella sp. JGI-2019a]KAG9028708.1 hypothetical protein FRB95_006150 [Tulasnella sp. JGI-2019a]
MSIPIQISAQQLHFVVFTGDTVLQTINIPGFNPSSKHMVSGHSFRYPWYVGDLGSRRGFQVSKVGGSKDQYWSWLTYGLTPNSDPPTWTATEVWKYSQDMAHSIDSQYSWQLDESSGRVIILTVAG